MSSARVDAVDGQAVAVDTLAKGIDLEPLYDLMRDESVTKVFHSASQDMAVFYSVMGELPRPVFDTQVAAMVCGFGEQPAYATLASKILGVQLDKASQLTDWARRPLTERQVEYALKDVIYLKDIYEELQQQLGGNGRAEWVAEEMEALTDVGSYAAEPRQQWRRVRLRRPTRRALAILREVAAWREENAQRRNLPRGWVLRDEALAEIAANAPVTPDDLDRVRGVQSSMAHGKDGASILAAVRHGMDLPESECPELPPRREALRGHESLVSLLQALLRLRCEAHGVAPKIVAGRRDLELLASEDDPDVKSLHGWRREIFGEDALALRDGKLALTGEGHRAKLLTPPG